MINALIGVSQALRQGSIAGGGLGEFGAGGVAARGGGGFGEMLEKMATEVSGSLKNGEQAAVAGVLGTQGVQSTVEAVMGAEQSLQVGIGVRDRIVNAYLEISRMAI